VQRLRTHIYSYRAMVSAEGECPRTSVNARPAVPRSRRDRSAHKSFSSSRTWTGDVVRLVRKHVAVARHDALNERWMLRLRGADWRNTYLPA
jgi:hypothetical protein